MCIHPTVLICVLLIILSALPSLSREVGLYVAPDGNDRWSGRLAEPTADKTDGPFATLEAARNAIRAMKTADAAFPPAGGVTVWVRGGIYERQDSFTLSDEDSGFRVAPIVYRAYPGETPRLVGGRVITGFTPVTDAGILERLPQAARAHVVQVDLRAQGITDYGALKTMGFSWPRQPMAMELFFDAQPMTMARWPNEGFAVTTSTPTYTGAVKEVFDRPATASDRFGYPGENPARWQDVSDAWVFGSWNFRWDATSQKIAAVDAKTHEITTEPPHHQYGCVPGQPFFAMHVLEELDRPGEYYLDRKAGRLYFWPPAPVAEGTAIVSLMETPLLATKGAAYVSFIGLTFECVRGDAIEIDGGANVLLAGCTVRNTGLRGIAVTSGFNHGVRSCAVYDTGAQGIFLDGGDRTSLTPGGNYALNNEVSRFSRLVRVYANGIELRGVGQRAVHNYLHHAPHMGIGMYGNDLLIELNEVHTVLQETGDAGVIHPWANMTERGNTIRYNHLHHIGGGGIGTSLIYFDDWISGNTVYGNILQATANEGRYITSGVYIHGGLDNIVENNIFLDCSPRAVFMHPSGFGDYMKTFMEEMPYKESPWRDKYPELTGVLPYLEAKKANKDLGRASVRNLFRRNIVVGKDFFTFAGGNHEEDQFIYDNLVGVDPHFVDAEAGDYRLREDSPAWQIGFQPIPVGEIGLMRDEYRPKLERVQSHLEALDQPSAGRPGRVRLTAVNQGDVASSGTVRLRVVPQATPSEQTEPFTYTLQPGEEVSHIFTVTPGAGMMSIETACDAGAFRPSRLRLDVPLVLERQPRTADRNAALASLPELLVEYEKVQPLGTLQLGVVGDQLLVRARVREARFARTEPYTESASVEVFLSLPGQQPVGACILQPATENAPATGFVLHNGQRQATTAMQVESRRIEEGYELFALVPLAELVDDPQAAAFNFDACITAAPWANGHYFRATLCKGYTAHNSADKIYHATLQVK